MAITSGIGDAVGAAVGAGEAVGAGVKVAVIVALGLGEDGVVEVDVGAPVNVDDGVGVAAPGAPPQADASSTIEMNVIERIGTS